MMRWLPPDLPERADVDGLTFRPLTPALLVADYAAVMRDVPMLRAWSGQDWPTPAFSIEEDLVDLVRHDREQREGVALTYSVMRGETLLGCIYVRPMPAALATRGIVAEPPLPVSGHVVVRGWGHDCDEATLISAALEFLRGAPFEFPGLWWQTNVDCHRQLAACDALGLTRRMFFAGPTTTWVLAAPVA